MRVAGGNTVGIGFGSSASQIGEKLGVNGGAYVNGTVTATTVVSTVSRGTSYAVTSSTTSMAYIDTGITNYFNVSYGAVYQVFVQANPNQNGSGSYTDNLYGKIVIGTGWSGSAVTSYIYFVQENIPRPYNSGGTEPTIDAVFNNAGSEVTSYTTGGVTPKPQIRLKVGFPSNQGIGSPICYITRVA